MNSPHQMWTQKRGMVAWLITWKGSGRKRQWSTTGQDAQRPDRADVATKEDYKSRALPLRKPARNSSFVHVKYWREARDNYIKWDVRLSLRWIYPEVVCRVACYTVTLPADSNLNRMLHAKDILQTIILGTDILQPLYKSRILWRIWCFLRNDFPNTRYIACDHCYATASGTKVDTCTIILTVKNS
jgi:hypothetical protein